MYCTHNFSLWCFLFDDDNFILIYNRMPIIYHNTPSAGVAPRTNDQALQTNWRDIMELVPHDSLPVHFRSVLPWLFRSNIPFPQQLQAIYATGVRSIITLTESRELFEDARSTGQLPDDMTIHHYPVNQRHYLTLSEIINVCRIIHEARSVGNVMVNCLGGMTRTGLVIGANHAISERHEPLDHFDRCIGLRDFVRR